jgi:FixJ family two-component response regulator
MPRRCPECDTPVEREEGEVAVRCPNRACPGVRRQRLRHFCSRAGMNIEGLGRRLIDQLLDASLIDDPASLWDLDPERLAQLPQWGEKSAANLLGELSEAKSRPLWRLLVALGIRHVGERAAKVLAAHSGSLEALSKMSEEELQQVEGVGPTIAASLTAFFADRDNRRLIDRLRRRGVDPRQDRCKRRGAAARGPGVRPYRYAVQGARGGRRTSRGRRGTGGGQRLAQDQLRGVRRGPRIEAREGATARRCGARRGGVAQTARRAGGEVVRKARIVLVDDDEGSRVAMATGLRRVGLEVSEFDGGDAALGLVSGDDQIDVLITDVRMPGMDGYQLLGAVRSARPELPVLMVTAFGDIDGAVRALKEGANDYLSKPVNLAELRHRVEQLLERQELSEEKRQLEQRLERLVGAPGLVAHSPSMIAVVERVRSWHPPPRRCSSSASRAPARS